MDFLNMNFSMLFLEKHGKEVFESICEMIKREGIDNYDNQYIEIIFKIAFLDFFGMKENQIENMIIDIIKSDNIDIKKLKNTHYESINTIKEYIKDETNIKL